MTDRLVKQTVIRSAVFFVLVAAAILVPRLFAENGGGFPAATNAATVFLLLAGAAGLVALLQFLWTWRYRRILPAGAQIAGFAPLPLAIVGGLAFWWFATSSQAALA